jgi:hypothetical protein
MYDGKKGQATPEEIEAWKQKYGKVYFYTVDGRVCYLRQVDRELYARASIKLTTSPAKFNEVIIEGVWLGGDDDIRKKDEYYFGLFDFLADLMAIKKGELGEC